MGLSLNDFDNQASDCQYAPATGETPEYMYMHVQGVTYRQLGEEPVIPFSQGLRVLPYSGSCRWYLDEVEFHFTVLWSYDGVYVDVISNWGDDVFVDYDPDTATRDFTNLQQDPEDYEYSGGTVQLFW